VIRLVCWNADLAKERARGLKEAGLRVDATPLNPAILIRHFRESSPSVALIDLDKLPSQGREVGVALRNHKATRTVPIVFAGGAEEKVARVREVLPDAFFTDWKRVVPALKRALKNAPAQPVQPVPMMQRYTGSSLAKKLGFKPGIHVALFGAPDGFEQQLGDLPEGARLHGKLAKDSKLAIWFVHSRSEMESAIEHSAVRMPEGASVWIVYPKQASPLKVDFTQFDVRKAGLSLGLVDYKICAVDADWTAMKFARRKS
jgi:hypothetical protein